MFCSNCGMENDKDDVFCEKCGKRLVQKKFKLTRKMIAIGAAVAVVLAASVAFVCVGYAGSGYKKAAREYAQAVLECDWDTAYDLVDFPESEFLTKEIYKEIHKDETPKDLVSITVAERQESQYDRFVQDTGKRVTVTYLALGESQSDMNLRMDVLPEKYMMFFKQYKVNSRLFLTENVYVMVPFDSKLTVNGVEVGDTYKTTSDPTGVSTKMMDEYKIPYLFKGNNTFKVTGEMIEDYETTFWVDGSRKEVIISSSKVRMKEGILDNLLTQAETDLKMIADASLKNKDISKISNRISPSDLNAVKERYGHLLLDCHSSYGDVLTLELSDIKTNMKSEGLLYDLDDGTSVAKVMVSYVMQGTYTEKESPDEVKNGKRSASSQYIKYKYTDGEWKICEISLGFHIASRKW